MMGFVGLSLAALSSTLTLGFRPFMEPIPLDKYWMLLLIPLVVGISVVYKTIKMSNLKRLPYEATVMALQIIAFMIMAAFALWMITELV